MLPGDRIAYRIKKLGSGRAKHTNGVAERLGFRTNASRGARPGSGLLTTRSCYVQNVGSRVLCVAACVVASGCGLLIDTSGLSGQAAEATAPPGGPEGGVLVDSGADAGQGSTDAGTGADATPSTECEPHFFVDDFDTGPLGGTWDLNTTEPGVTNRLDTTNPFSAPNAFAVDVSSASTGSAGYLRKNFAPKKTLCVSTQFLVTSTQADFIRLADQSSDYRLTLSRSVPFGITEDNFHPTHDTRRNVASFSMAAGWRRLRLEVAFPPAAGKGVLRVFVDGTLAATGDVGSDSDDLTLTQVTLGILFSQFDGAGARYDDVVIAGE